MKKKRIEEEIDDKEKNEELEKTNKKKKTTKKKTRKRKTKEEKKQDKNQKKESKKLNRKEKKETKKIKKEEKKSSKKNKNTKKRKKRKLNVLNIFIVLISLILVSVAVAIVLFGVGVLKINIKDPGPTYTNLSEVVAIGDYVDYDAGNWDSDKEIPNRNVPFTFGGYGLDVSRNDGVSCNNSEITNKGWRVFSVEEDVVTLIQSGISMCYYHGYGALTNDTSVNILSNLDENNKFDYFLDGKYSESVRMLSKEDIDKFSEGDSSYTRIRNNLINVGTPYWLATKNGSYYMWYVTEGGSIAVDHVGTYGVRVLVNLKKDVKTIGPNKDGAWRLAEEDKKDE